MLFDNIRSLFTFMLATSIGFMFFNMNEEDRFQQDYLFFYFLCDRGGIQ